MSSIGALTSALFNRRISPYGGMVAALVLTYGTLFSWLATLKHQTWHSYFWDLGILDQVVWNTAQGRFLETSFYGYGSSYLGEHLSPILAAFAPLYLVWDDVRLLLIVQSLYMAAGAWPIYLLAKKKLGSERGAVLLSAAFLLFPNIAYTNLFDFHPETLLVLLLPWAFYFLHEDRDSPFLATVGLSLLVKEDVALLVFALGLYAAFFKGKRPLGLALAILGLGWFAAATYWVIPHFRGEGYRFLIRYSHLGSSASEIIVNLVTNPLNTLQFVFSFQKLYYLFQLLSPLAFLPLLNPALAGVALPILAGNLLSNSPIQTSILFQYSVSTGPIFFVATIGALTFLFPKVQRLLCQDCYARNSENISLALALGVFLFSLNGAGWDNPIGHYLRQGNFAPRSNQAVLEEAKALIPPNASLAVSNMLGSQVAHRRQLFFFPPLPFLNQPTGVEFFLVDVTDWDVDQPGGIRGQLAQAAPAGEYETLLEKDNIILLKKR